MRQSQDVGLHEAAAAHLTEDTFAEALVASQGMTMVSFWAERSRPSRALAPVLEAVAQAAAARVRLVDVNVDESPALAARYSVGAVPTILFVKGGKVVDRVVGAASKALLESILKARA
jgi:thioredoxin 1